MAVRVHFAEQAAACRRLGSPFTGRLLELLAERLDDRSAIGGTVLGWPGDPRADALALRLAGGLHALVLAGTAPSLAAVYPGGTRQGHAERLWAALVDALERHAEALRAFLEHPPQTNEVARAGVLAGGFMTVAAETGRPLTLLEIGASAGLNLHWDGYAYDLGGASWGGPAAPVRLAPEWQGGRPPLGPVSVVGRAGCDRRPIDPADPAARLRLRAYVWADQAERLARLEAALDHAARGPLRVEQADAADWVERRLTAPHSCAARVIFHSIVWQYLDAPTRMRITRALARAGGAATADAPLAWLRMEPARGEDCAELRLTLWPDGQERLLARADYHVRWVAWEA